MYFCLIFNLSVLLFQKLRQPCNLTTVLPDVPTIAGANSKSVSALAAVAVRTEICAARVTL